MKGKFKCKQCGKFHAKCLFTSYDIRHSTKDKPATQTFSLYCIMCRHNVQPESIAFKDVKRGDLVFDAGYYVPDKWIEVKEVTTKGDNVTLTLNHCCFVGHRLEGIAVKRC